MKVYCAFLLFFFVLIMHANGQQNGYKELSQTVSIKSSLSGVITDSKTAIPLGGATIFFPDLKKGTISDDKGFYEITSVNSGRYLIEISYQGYSSIAETVEIYGDTKHNFSLAPSIMEQEAVTVTGVSFATRLKHSPQPVTVIKQNDLLNMSSVNLMEALSKSVPGLSILTTGPAIAKPFIRGLGYNRVITVNDGVKQEGQQWGDEHGIEIDEYSAQRIEVLKGPASLIYGSDAIAGVINIQSQVPASEGILKSNIESEYQTSNGLRAVYGNISGTKKGFSWNAYGDYKGAHDYQNRYDGYVFNSKFYNKNFGGMLGYAGKWGSSRLLISQFDQHLGIIVGERDDETGAFIKPLPGGNEAIATNEDFKRVQPEVPFQHIRHFKVTSDNSFQMPNNKRLDIILAFQRNQRQEFGNPDDTDLPDAYFDLKTLNYAIRFHLPSNKNWKTSFGVNGMYQTNVNRAGEVIIPNYNLFDIGGFVYTQYTKNKLSISGGLRLDDRYAESKAMEVDNELKFTHFTRDFFNVSGSAGLAFQATKELTLKANIARGFRAPNFAELASNGAHEGTNRYEVGNSDLKSEISTQLDAGVEVNTEHVTLSGNIFYNNIGNFIFYEKMQDSDGQDSVIIDAETGNSLNVFRFDQHNAYLFGVEAVIDIHPHPLDWLHFENSFSLTKGRFSDAIDGSKNLPLIPAARILSELKGNFLSSGKAIKNLYVSVAGDYTFEQNNPFTGYNTETRTGSYFLLNAGLGADIVSKGKTICSIHLSAINLGDVAYQNHLSRLKYTPVNNVTGRQGVYEMGRNFTFKVLVPLNFKI